MRPDSCSGCTFVLDAMLINGVPVERATYICSLAVNDVDDRFAMERLLLGARYTPAPLEFGRLGGVRCCPCWVQSPDVLREKGGGVWFIDWRDLLKTGEELCRWCTKCGAEDFRIGAC